MYFDDDTEVVTDEDPNCLHRKIQRKADCSSRGLKDNHRCVWSEK